jgi:hypothetical protein
LVSEKVQSGCFLSAIEVNGERLPQSQEHPLQKAAATTAKEREAFE